MEGVQRRLGSGRYNGMGVIGSPLETAPLQAVQAQQVASKARDREKTPTPTGRRFNDLVELRVAGLETAEAVRHLPQNDSEQAQSEHESHDLPPEHAGPGSRAHIDLKA